MPSGEQFVAESAFDRTQRVRPRPQREEGSESSETPPPRQDLDSGLIDVGQSTPSPSPFPRAGDKVLHFELVEEIGRGSFARVFLARQESLANRLVVLKLTTLPTDEPQNLARLRHTNVVPIYSVHADGPLQVLCMPYLGRVTLAQILATPPAHGPRSGRELFDAVLGIAAAHGPSPALADVIATLGRLSPVEACLWFVGQLAAGLGHAHAHHLLHRDLKPANVLLTDDGVPMLLDFNVSCESARGSGGGTVGGTLPYMAPEHLRAFLDPQVPLDERSDLYSLGVILYELLTDRLPYPLPDGPTSDAVIRAMIAQHGDPPPPPSRYNAAISPAVDEIVLKLLAPDPRDRYTSATEAREDLTRQLSHRPLKFARNTSLRERLGKWRRRNPALTVAGLVFALLVLPASLVVVRQVDAEARAARLQTAAAEGVYATTAADVRAAETLLGSRSDAQSREQGLSLATAALARYGIGDDPDWESRADFALLDGPRRASLKVAFGELLILMSRVEATAPGGVTAAVRWNQLAEEMYGDDDRPAVLARHREEFALRQAGKAVPVFVAPRPTQVRDTDLYFDGLDLAAADRFDKALPLLSQFCDRNPPHFLAWFARGVCHDALNQPADAQTAFAVCVALRPESPAVYANRGLARLRLRRYAAAEADLTRALELKPGWLPALLNRGLAREKLLQFNAAEQDFTAALAASGAPTRIFFLRSRVRRAAGNIPGADADKVEGTAREPNDALSWAARGLARLAAKEPAQALADFDAALAISPGMRDALLNKAVILADHQHREADAIPVLDQLLSLYPDQVDARCSRGVYHARLGHAAEARRDADDALKADATGYRLFQVAGLYAQLSKAEGTDKAKDLALGYLARAIQAGFADSNLLESDTDLDPVRKDPRFAQTMAAAKEIKRLGQPATK
ncbi:protein kinase domain-containing protein [Limnoglobus roseus]|uniref:non-specific serine/threonine protein kinase n=1 Tax=Limnoglobus roseus TaxID=2598579 RepID=A0A5C1AEG1_9BACT|nr:protein kinase [Limnoglobus roseus]QEL17789.1 tetratricopeptide repeat protein [Limnoglobus roseus]